MFKLPPLIWLLALGIVNSASGIGENELTIPKDILLSQKIIIRDPYIRFYPESRNQPAKSIGEFYGTAVQTKLSLIDPGPSLTNLLQQQHPRYPTITLSKQAFSYPPLLNFYSLNHIKTIGNIYPGRQEVITLIGPPQSGKTLALRYLYESERKKMPNLLSIFVDLPDIFKNLDPSSFKDLSVDFILNTCVSHELIEFVKNVQKVKPERLRFLFDGVDQIPRPAQEKILNIIAEFLNKGVLIATSSHSDIIGEHLKKLNHHITPRKVLINSDIYGKNLRQYMTEYWIKKLELKNVHLDKQLVHDYYTALEIIMQNSPLPWKIATMQQFADYFSDPTIEKLIPDVSVYALKSNTHRPKLSEIIQLGDRMRFPKMEFYNKYFENLQPYEVEYYGIEAVRLLGEKNGFTFKEWEKAATRVNQLLVTHTIDGFPYLVCNKYTQIKEFVHSDYLHYFAARQILASFTTDTPYIETFSQVLMVYRLHFVAEYINNYIDEVPEGSLADVNSPLWRSMPFFNKVYTHNVVINLIGHGFDGLCSKVLERIGSQQTQMYLFDGVISRSSPLFQFSRFYKVFKMLPAYRNYPPQKNYASSKELTVPRKKNEVLLNSKFDFILRHDMVKTHEVILKYKCRYTTDYLMRAALKSSVENLASLLAKNPAGHAHLAYESLEKLRPKSVEILRTLKKYGTQLSQVMDENGRTLAHIAVQWADPDLLETIHKEFLVPLVDKPDKSGRTILFTALDSSPFLISTSDGFWPMMEYLIKHGDLRANYGELQKIISNKLFETTTPMHRLHKVMFPAGLLSDADKEMIPLAQAAFQCVPLKDWDLPADELSARRNAVIKDSSMYVLEPSDYVTLSEVIIKHRSLDTLSERSQRAYENTVFEIIQREIMQWNLNPNQLQRIFMNLVKNIHTRLEFMRMKAMYLSSIRPSIGPQSFAVIDDLFDLREQNQMIQDPPRNGAGKIVGLTTRMDVDSSLIDDSVNKLQPNAESNEEIITAEWRAACAEMYF